MFIELDDNEFETGHEATAAFEFETGHEATAAFEFETEHEATAAFEFETGLKDCAHDVEIFACDISLVSCETPSLGTVMSELWKEHVGGDDCNLPTRSMCWLIALR